MICNQCNNQMSQGIYKCGTHSYDIWDLNGKPLYTWLLHDLPPNDDEIGSECPVTYCLNCHILFM